MVDVSDATAPRLIGFKRVEESGALGVAVTEDQVYVAAHEDGLYVLASQCEATGGVATDSHPAAVETRLTTSPNPAWGGVVLRFAPPDAGPIEVRIHDINGRQVRSFSAEATVSGPETLAWDGRDNLGRLVPAGLYLVRVSSDRGSAVTRQVIVR